MLIALITVMGDMFTLVVKIVVFPVFLLLILRALMTLFAPGLIHDRVTPLHRVTDMWVNPIRTILPWRYWRRRLDISPIIASLVLLLAGLGLVEICTIMVQRGSELLVHSGIIW